MSSETIILVGVCDKPESTNVSQAKYFEKLGYNIIPVNYRTIIYHHGIEFFEKLLIHIVDTHTPKLVLFSKCNGVPSSLIRKCSDITTTWLWFMDYVHNLTPEILEHVKNATFASATSSEVVKYFKEYNENSHWIIEGYDPDICFNEKSEKVYDKVFIGNATDKRVHTIKNTGLLGKIAIFGSWWPSEFNASPPVYKHAFRKVVCQSNWSLNFVHGNIFSNRVVESLACGTPVLSEYCSDLEQIFPDVLFFGTELDRERIIPANIKEYTWENVLKRVMEIVNEQ